MTAKAKKAASPLLAALHDTATDLHKAGFMDLKSLRQYDALCLDDEVFEAKDIVKLRSQLQISQGVLAAFVNTTTSSVAPMGGWRQAPRWACSSCPGVAQA